MSKSSLDSDIARLMDKELALAELQKTVEKEVGFARSALGPELGHAVTSAYVKLFSFASTGGVNNPIDMWRKRIEALVDEVHAVTEGRKVA